MPTAETIAKTLGGRKAGGGWMARCPAHDDRESSLSIRDADDGKVLIRCHAGCEPSVWSLLSGRAGCGKTRAIVGSRALRKSVRVPRRRLLASSALGTPLEPLAADEGDDALN
jgi:hypothetical protein